MISVNKVKRFERFGRGNMQITEITYEKVQKLKQNVKPNVIHNRFDILFDSTLNNQDRGGATPDFELFKLEFENGEFYIPVHIDGDKGRVGMYLRRLEKKYWQEFVSFLFKRYPKLEDIWVLHTYTELSGVEAKPHWHIDLPDSIEEFDAALNVKTRYDTKRYPRKIRENIGEYKIVKLPAAEIKEEIVNQYLNWKYISHGYVWGKEPLEYLSSTGITEAYLMKCQDRILAIGFICTTDENVFLENYSYTPEYKKYSLASVLYHYIISDLILQKKKNLDLLGGEWEYKRRYNGIRTETYTGHIYRHPFLASVVEKISQAINKMPFSYRIRKRCAKFAGLFLFNRYYARLLKGEILK